MKIMEIKVKGSSVLRKKSKRVSSINNDIRKFCAEMAQTMRDAKGIGISAPQVGVSKRIIIVNDDGNDWVLINPEIIWDDGKKVSFNEGCLSVPGEYADILRPDRIRVKYRELSGRPQTVDLDGLLSRIVQHEIDHLNGILFTDYLTDEGSLITI